MFGNSHMICSMTRILLWEEEPVAVAMTMIPRLLAMSPESGRSQDQVAVTGLQIDRKIVGL